VLATKCVWWELALAVKLAHAAFGVEKRKSWEVTFAAVLC
jgi:hypothetical protein